MKLLTPLKLWTLIIHLIWLHCACIAAESPKPSARWGHVFVYDATRNEILLFGGADQPRQFLSDTWTWDENGWKHHKTNGPGARGFSAAAYHVGRQSIVIHGGRGENNQNLSDTWEWNGQQWIQLNTSSDFVADHHEMVYLPQKDAMLAFGGWDGHQVNGNTWLWKNEWQQVQTESPPPRSAFGMAYDSDQKAVIMYGGLWINGQYADIWQWKNDRWQTLSGPYDNSSLDHHTLVYDEKNQKTIGFGGKNYRYRPQAKTWQVSAGKVIELSRAGPNARHSTGFTYHRKHEKSYLFGGKHLQNNQQIPLADFWYWDGTSWNQIK